MKNVLTVEIWVDETLKDAKECVDQVYNNMCHHEYISDGSVEIKIVRSNLK